MEAISECPICHSKNLEQDFHIPSYCPQPRVIGGEVTTTPPILDGCHCNHCGTKSVANKAGKCPACKGTGQYTARTYRCGIEQRSTKSQCSLCKGKGVIE